MHRFPIGLSDIPDDYLLSSSRGPSQSNEIKKSCPYDQCNENSCLTHPMPLNDLTNRLIYEPIKLCSSRSPGVFPLSKSPSFRCRFLSDWVKSSNSCKFLSVVAMYNESWSLFHHTLEGLLENVNSLQANSKLDIRSEDIGAIFIVDGLEPFLRTFYKIDLKDFTKGRCVRSNMNYFSQLFNLDMISECFPGSDLNSGDFSKISKLTERLYSSGALAKDEELAHLFSQRVKFDNGVFLNLMFCVKHENKRKLNTHKWFFEGFCKIINPLYIALLDVGTRPREKGLYYLYKALHYDKRTAGCCGEIIPQTKFSNILVMAQMVEYKISHIFDKAVESHIGYISVLPGAFSAYRWEAINRPEIMNIYFRSQRRGEKLDMFQANMYLAEDRILCLELMCQEKRSNFLRYVKESIAETDVPESLNELLAQRRRWINGSWFSMIYAIRRCNKIDTSGHSTTTKIFFKLLMIYYSLASLFSWLLVGALYFSFTVTFNFLKSKSRGDYKEILEYATGSILFLYTGLLIITLIYSFAVKPKKVENHLWWMSFILGGLTLLNMGNVGLTIRIGIKDIEPGENYLDTMKYFMIIFIPGTFILILILSCFNGIKETLKLAYGLPFYFCVMGIYYNIFTIYAISNTHDCSWGNRPDKRTDEENQLVFRYKNERTRWALVWIFSNLLFVKVCTYLGLNDDKYGIAFLLFLSALVIIPTTLKFLMALFYLTSERISKSRKSRLSINN